MIKVDARGLSCPEPVILLSESLKDNDSVEIMLDTFASCENCKNFAASKGFKCEVEEQNDEFIMVVSK